MKLTIKRGGNPFKQMAWDWSTPVVSKGALPIIGALVKRDAKRGARKNIGGNFGADISNSVSQKTDRKAATVVVGSSHFAASHKQFGGTIEAPGKGPLSRRAKYLTIPISEEAKNRSARTFNNTFLLIRPGRNPLIMQNLTGGEVKPLFVLVKSVTQKAYKWFPDEKKAVSLARKGMGKWLAKRKR